MNTAVLWIRVSSEMQTPGYSLDSQEHEVAGAAKGYAVRRAFKVTESAKTSEKRQLFQEMIKFVKAKHIGHLFAWSHDRLARHHKDFSTLQSLVDENDVSIHLVESGKVINRESPVTDRFMFQIMAALAEADNRTRAAHTRRGLAEKVRQGGWPHRAPIGYLNTKDAQERKIVILDPERAPLIKWTFEAFAKGRWSTTTMARELRSRGLTTPPTPKRAPHPPGSNAVQAILRNPFYYGEGRAFGKQTTGKHEPLVTKEVWLAAQARLDRNRLYTYPGTKR